jgi:UDP-N-acetylmuramate dehydrogenase
MEIQEQVALAPLTTLQVGGEARYFVEGRTEDEVREAAQYAQSRALPLFVLGGGSNLLVSDAGWPGLVLRISVAGIEQHIAGDGGWFEAGAGEEWDTLVARTVAANCAGIECLSGIPGSVGGTPVQNVGAYGQEVAEAIAGVRAMELDTGNVREFSNAECGFRYRESIFNTSERRRWVIVRVKFRLKPDGAPRLAYVDLKKHFAGWERTPTLGETRAAVRQIRAAKSMLITPGDPDSRSAGSFFKNPVLSEGEFAEVRRRAAGKGWEIPSYPALEAQRKVSAAWLVEHSGFAKGYRLGRAGISSKHALALVNCGGATAADIVALKNEVQQKVEAAWGVRLEPEPVMVGF